jgi:hypothetical protein
MMKISHLISSFFAAAIFFGSFNVAAAASDTSWVEVTKSNNVTLYVNPDDVSRNEQNKTVQLWSRYELKNPRIDTNVDPARKVGSYIEKITLYCEQKYYTIEEILSYDEKFAFISRWKSSAPDKFSIAPGTLAYDRFKYMCK